ncbi:MAG: chromosomal replication initiator protein DnaA [Rhodomicrobium sp.]|nr:MAG: chromosomal replication initiator protein DnaA [Rhodomicrobium sp.]
MTDMRGEQALQLALDFPHRPAMGLEDFFVSGSNRAALQQIDLWPNWSAPALYLQGPKGSGKSHLAHVWQLASEAVIFSAADFDMAAAEAHDGDAIVIEDLDVHSVAGRIDERALFHLINLAKEQGFHILFSGAMAPGQIEISLPDFRSRLRALPVAAIEAPDDMLLRTMLIKQFQDRQIDVQPNLIEYILPRMERSFVGVGQLVELLDKSALQSGRRITRQFAGEILKDVP